MLLQAPSTPVHPSTASLNAPSRPRPPTPADPSAAHPLGLPTGVGAVLVVAACAGLAAIWPAPPAPRTGPGGSSHGAALSAAEAGQAEWRAQVCTSANAVGVGLRGEYFARPGAQGEPLLARTDPTLDFVPGADWPAGTPAPRSARWKGWVRAPMAGRYRFHAEPASVSIEVSGRAVAGRGVGAADAQAGVELAAGRFYPIAVTWDAAARGDPAAEERLRLQWTAPHGARFTIPRNSLFLPTETVTTGR